MNESQSSETTTIVKWSTDRIVAFGLVIMGVVAVAGNIAYALLCGSNGGTEIPMAIVSGLTGFLGRGLLNEQEAKKMANAATQQIASNITNDPKEKEVAEAAINYVVANITNDKDKAEEAKKQVTNAVVGKVTEMVTNEAEKQLGKIVNKDSRS